jgi:hypothetical protein
LTPNEFAEATGYPALYIEQQAAACDEIMGRKPGTTLHNLVLGAGRRSDSTRRKDLFTVLWLHAAWQVFHGAQNISLKEWVRVQQVPTAQPTEIMRAAFAVYLATLPGEAARWPR